MEAFNGTDRQGSLPETIRQKFEVLDLLKDVVFVHDIEGKFVYVNEAAWKTRGYAREELLRMNLSDILFPEMSQKIAERLRLLLEKGELMFESGHICKDGTAIPVEVHSCVREWDGRKYVMSVARDITDRKKAEAEIRAYQQELERLVAERTEGLERSNEALHREIAEHRRTGEQLVQANMSLSAFLEGLDTFAFVKNRDGVYIMVNAAVERALGKPRNEIVGRNDVELFGPETGALLRGNDLQVIETKRPRTAEETNIFPGRCATYLNHKAPVFDPNGEVVGVCGVTIDITHQKEMEEALRESERNLREAQRIACVGNWTRDLATGAISCSDEAFRIFGVAERNSSPTFDSFMAFVHPDDRDKVVAAIQRVLDGMPSSGLEHRIVRPDGAVRTVLQTSEVVRDGNGQPLRLFGTIQDITERRQAEEEIRRSKEQLALALEGSRQGLIDLDFTSNAAYLSPLYYELIRYEPGSFTPTLQWFQSSMHPEDLPLIEEHRRRHILGETPYAEMEFRFRTGTGEYTWLSERSRIVERDAAGRPLRLVGLISDISERKKLEEALRESEALLANAQRIAHIGSWNWDLERNVMTWSAEVYRILGLRQKDAKATVETFTAAVHPDDREKFDTSLAYVLSGKTRENLELRIVQPDGEIRTIYLQGESISGAAGKPVRLVGSVLDITDRKRAEEAVHRSEEQLALAMESSRQGLWDWDFDRGTTFMNARYCEIVGWKAGTFPHTYEWFLSAIHPNDVAVVTGAMRNHIEGKSERSDVEYRFRTAEGEYRWVHGIGKVVQRDAQGKALRMVGLIRDISEHKRLEAALLASNDELEQRVWERTAELAQARDRFEQIFMLAPHAILTVDLESRITRINKRAEEITGFREDEVIGQKCSVFAGWDCGERCSLFAEDIPKPIIGREIVLHRKNGEQRVIVKNVDILRDRDGKVVGGIESFTDITDMRRAEEARHESEEKFRRIVETANEGIWTVDAEIRTVFVNDKITEMLGYGADEIIGKPMEAFVVPEEIEAHRRRCEERRQGKKGFYDRRIVHRNGQVRWMRVSSSPMFDARGRFAGAITMLSDITDHKRATEDLKKLYAHLYEVREEERKGIARELHDELGQYLTALRMDISWLERHRAAPEEQSAEKLQGMTKLVDATIKTVQRISSALRPGILDSLGLASAVEWLAEDFKKRSGITCRVDCVYESSHGERHETILFRILQEALTNIARHSGATEVHVTLEDNGDSISLEVRDNGRGITKKQVEDHQSLGIIGMRERVQYLSGSISISGKRGQGTTVRIVLPVEQQ